MLLTTIKSSLCQLTRLYCERALAVFPRGWLDMRLWDPAADDAVTELPVRHKSQSLSKTPT